MCCKSLFCKFLQHSSTTAFRRRSYLMLSCVSCMLVLGGGVGASKTPTLPSWPWRRVRLQSLSSQVEANGIGFYKAVFDSRQWMVVEQRRLQRPGSLRRRAQRQRWCCGCRSLALCAAAGTCQAATILPCGDVDDARFPTWHAARPCPRPCLRRG